MKICSGGQSLAITNDGAILLGVQPTIFAASSGIFRSIDDGENWVHVDSSASTFINQIAISPNGFIFANKVGALGQSIDGGSTWNDISINIGDAIAIGRDGKIFGSNYSSTDNGNTWVQDGIGARSIDINSVGDAFGAVWNSGVFRSIDNGFTWDKITSGLLDSNVVSTLGVSRNDYLFAGTATGSRIWRSIKPSTFFFKSYTRSEGWNLVSVSLRVDDYRKSALYPFAVSNAFAYHSSYVVRDTLRNGIGYWLKYETQSQDTISGLSYSQDTIAVTPGWNLVGSTSVPLPTSSITSQPSGIIVSPFYGYQSVYVIADTIHSGEGYWVKVNANGKIILRK